MLENKLNSVLNNKCEQVYWLLNDLKSDRDGILDDYQYVLDYLNKENFTNIMYVLEMGESNDIQRVCIMKIRKMNSVRDIIQKAIDEEKPLEYSIINNLRNAIDYEKTDDVWLNEFISTFVDDEFLDED